MKTIYGTLGDLKKFIKDRGSPQYAVLLRSAKTELPMAAWVYNGYSSGAIYTRRSLKSLKFEPSHNYANNQLAFNILKNSVLK